MKKKALYLTIVTILSVNQLFGQYSYLGTYTTDGIPNYLVQSDVISASTMSLINQALPENYPVPIYNPQYISSGYDTDIRLRQDADVWVTFVDEGAGYKNVLAFYTYDLNNPPTSIPANSQITIIFPNVSKIGGGGNLAPGSKVKIGSFKANTGIGFMLIADGWRNGAVTNGNWRLFSNPNFNPEANENLRKHNVLISDVENQRVILGFEDIRRDYGGCDNDFNDALFYVTANPYSAIISENFAVAETSTLSTESANLGGLESNGNLAMKIALRNFERYKNPTLRIDEKHHQVLAKSQKLKVSTEFNTASTTSPSNQNTNLELKSLLPMTGMFGTEKAYISSPSDLVKITNAMDVYSLDYYDGDDRVAAALTTYTTSKVYDHSKSICDRLNGASLQNVRTVTIANHKLINITFKKPNNEIEYALSFSIRNENGRFRLHSFWNIEQFPAGSYYNFQIWGKSMGQVCAIANSILSTISTISQLNSEPNETQIPDVFVKSGVYKNGKLQLNIINNSNDKSILVNSNLNATETEFSKSYEEVLTWKGEKEQLFELKNPPLFDAGLSITHKEAKINDILYLADGSWGVDYQTTEANEIDFKVAPQLDHIQKDNKIVLERSPVITGKVKGTFNLFRNVKAGNGSLDVSTYRNLSLKLSSTLPVEIVMVTQDLKDWEQRAYYIIEPNQGEQINIPLNKFVSKDKKVVELKNIKSVVLTVRGDYQKSKSFNLSVADMSFNNDMVNPLKSPEQNLTIYPNPVLTNATFTLPENSKANKYSIIDAAGKLVLQRSIENGQLQVDFDGATLKPGIYFIKTDSNNANPLSGKFLKN